MIDPVRASLKWKKLGKIFDPADHVLPNRCKEYAQSPQALVFDDFVRIYFSTRERDASGKFLWPGYGENVRVLKWIIERIEGQGAATETPIGFVPTSNALTLDGLDVSRATMEELLRVDPADWTKEHADVGDFFNKFGDRLPEEIREEHNRLGERLQRMAVVPK